MHLLVPTLFTWLGATTIMLAGIADAALSANALRAQPLARSSHGHHQLHRRHTLNAQAQRRADLVPIHIDGFITYSNDPEYTYDQAAADLTSIMRWAGDAGRLSSHRFKETVAAILDVSNRYYSELPTKKIARTIMADIRAESDFKASMVSAGRDDSGSSWGLMQVSQSGSHELTFFKKHARIRSSHAGPLPDWPPSEDSVLNVHDLRTSDLKRPWLNIHVATFFQANLGKTGSLDPYSWARVHDGSRMSGGGMSRTVRTAYGSWVAGPHPDGHGSYHANGDRVSGPYLRRIMQGVAFLYGKSLSPSWLDGLELTPGLVDYQ